MLIEDASICESLQKIVTRLTPDPVLKQDLMQECLVRLWKLETERPGRTRSWYLQNCRFHLQHWLAAGRSLDSPKRAAEDKRVTIDGISDEAVLNEYHTNGEFIEVVSARDLVATLAGHLKPREGAVLGGLADGLVLHDIAVRLKLSYPTALKYRRKIAALTIKLGISPPLSYKKESARRVVRVNGVGRVNGSGTRKPVGHINGIKRHNPLPNILRANPELAQHVNGRQRETAFKPVQALAH